MSSMNGAITVEASSTRAADFLTLTKPRVNLLVVASTLAGYYMAAGDGGAPATLAAAVIGTALVSGGAAALNQIAERDTDGLMRRTRHRPMPSGRLQVGEARTFALALVATGLIELAFFANLLAAAVAGVTVVFYALIYTPLKRRTSFATVVGAVPGALPPLIGWAASRGSLDAAAWTLFAVQFLWQLPHFLAIAWLYRDDYGRAGFPMLPVIDPDGRSTARQAIAYAAALVPASLATTALGVTGTTYFATAGVLGLAFLGVTVWFGWQRTAAAARGLFVASIVYLPVLWILMIADRL
jgi:protoheme IX farnesyltransferase